MVGNGREEAREMFHVEDIRSAVHARELAECPACLCGATRVEKNRLAEWLRT